MKNLIVSLIPKTGEKKMTLKLVTFAVGFLMAIASLSTATTAFAADPVNKDDPKLQEPINQDATQQATTGTSADCPSGTCPKYFAPGYQNDGAAIEPADTAVPATSASPTKTKR
jgi:hypothetical protein